MAIQHVNVNELPLEETVVKIYRCSKVVRGGRRFSFGALVAIGDRSGHVGMGYGKANEVPAAVEKSMKAARREVVGVTLVGTTIPHEVHGRFGASQIKLVPASPGTGVIACSPVRAVLELAGIRDVLSKATGSTNPKNLVKATFDALAQLRSRESVEALRGVPLEAAAK
jgi:small subunit ribosomal protein S5